MNVLSPVSTLWPTVLYGAAVVAIVVAVRTFRHRHWFRCAVAALAVVVLGIGGTVAVVNIKFDYYRTWGDLVLGPHGRDVVPKSASLAQLVALAPPPATSGTGPAPPHATTSISPKARTVVARAVQQGHGVLVEVNIPGPASNIRTRGAWVYLPAAYFERTTGPAFPVLELFHGVPGGPATWLTVLHVQDDLDRLIASGAMPPVIVVMPTDNPSRFRSQECEDGQLALDATYLSTDVRAWAAQALPRASTGRWGVGGYSTGAFCAYLLLLQHPQDYVAAAGVDGYYHALDDAFARGLYRDSAERLADSPDWLWQHARPSLPVQLLVMQGTRDEDYGHAQAFRQELVDSAAPNLTLVSVDNPGAEHTATSWRTFDPLLVAWLARTVARADGGPSVRYSPVPLGSLVVTRLSTGPDLLAPPPEAAASPVAPRPRIGCRRQTPARRSRHRSPASPAPTPSASVRATPTASAHHDAVVTCGLLPPRHPRPQTGARGSH